jgi:hypothetical protein
MKRLFITSVAAGLVGMPVMSASGQTPYTLLTDNFSRTTSPANTPLGTPPTRGTTTAWQTWATNNWVSDWGANTGGKIIQNYTTYLESTGRNWKIDGTNGISGNWLNNGSPSHPLKLNNAGTTITEPIGIPGFAWVQINENFATNKTVTSGNKLRVEFDLYRTAGGNLSWSFGNADPTGVVNGNAGSPPTITANDISLYWRGFQASTFGMRDNGLLPSIPGIPNADTISYIGSPNLNLMPIPIKIEISGTNFLSGSSTIEMTVDGKLQDLNGSDPGNGYTFTWDGEAGAYMVFGSNNTPVEGTPIPADPPPLPAQPTFGPVYRASGIDNLKITVDLLLGDMNKDGVVNNQDIAPFVRALTDLPGYSAEFPLLDGTALGDVNLDGVLNNQDIAPFVALLTGPRPLADFANDPDFAPLLALVPEPTALSVLALVPLVLRRRR